MIDGVGGICPGACPTTVAAGNPSPGAATAARTSPGAANATAAPPWGVGSRSSANAGLPSATGAANAVSAGRRKATMPPSGFAQPATTVPSLATATAGEVSARAELETVCGASNALAPAGLTVTRVRYGGAIFVYATATVPLAPAAASTSEMPALPLSTTCGSPSAPPLGACATSSEYVPSAAFVRHATVVVPSGDTATSVVLTPLPARSAGAPNAPPTWPKAT